MLSEMIAILTSTLHVDMHMLSEMIAILTMYTTCGHAYGV